MEKLKLDQLSDLQTGLDSASLDHAIRNTIVQKATKSYRSIFLEHFFTYFNLINLVLFGLVCLTGRLRNAMFMGVVIANLVIGLVQEIRSKRTLDKLALLYQDKVQVKRDGKIETIPIDQIALGDLLLLKSGDQIPVDGVIRQGNCQVNESVLTGESDALDKKPGDTLYSGCYLVSGNCIMQAARVGEDTYSARLLAQAKRSKRYPSSLRDALEQIIRISSYLIVPVGILLFLKSYAPHHWKDAILSAVAAMVGMIPEGLVILTSIALSAASLSLARKKVLVQELYCIETLARVDVLCLDKTGTITQGTMNVEKLIPFQGTQEELKQKIANVYLSSNESNATAAAIREFVKGDKITQKPLKSFDFSSAVKAMGASFANESILIGAYGFIEAHPDPEILKQIDAYAAQGLRVLSVCQAGPLDKLEKGEYPCLGLILLQDVIRPDAKEILEYFEKQDVEIKIISGDDPLTVSAIAKRVGVQGEAFNMSKPLPAPLEQVMLEGSVFGRVTPDQKKEMVLALKKDGKTVAMTGDGVNDVLALKEADCSIAMGSGSQAARAIASLVLLQDQFEALPSILIQGRRVINNITRTASLFLVKTLFSFGLSVLTIFLLSQYPFDPIQLTLISTLTTGIPSFVLTLEPNDAKVSGRFLSVVLAKAIPGALSLVLVIELLSILQSFLQLDPDSFSTISTWLAGINALGVLIHVCLPLTTIRKILIVVMASLFVGLYFGFYNFFGFVPLSTPQMIFAGFGSIGVIALQQLLYQIPWIRFTSRFGVKKEKKEKAA